MQSRPTFFTRHISRHRLLERLYSICLIGRHRAATVPQTALAATSLNHSKFISSYGFSRNVTILTKYTYITKYII